MPGPTAMHAISLLCSPSGRLKPQPFIYGAIAVYLLGAASQLSHHARHSSARRALALHRRRSLCWSGSGFACTPSACTMPAGRAVLAVGIGCSIFLSVVLLLDRRRRILHHGECAAGRRECAGALWLLADPLHCQRARRIGPIRSRLGRRGDPDLHGLCAHRRGARLHAVGRRPNRARQTEGSDAVLRLWLQHAPRHHAQTCASGRTGRCGDAGRTTALSSPRTAMPRSRRRPEKIGARPGVAADAARPRDARCLGECRRRTLSRRDLAGSIKPAS